MKTTFAKANELFRAGHYEKALMLYAKAKQERPELAHVIEYNIRLAEKRRQLWPDQKDAEMRLVEANKGGEASRRVTVDIVVPVYNALDDVKKCLTSLEKYTDGYDVRVIIVNDGSNAETTEWLREYCGRQRSVKLELIEHSENKGYTRAVNAGLRTSVADYVILQNSDTIVSAGWLLGLIRCMNSAPKIGIVGPLSNAASWQNIPILYDENGRFAVNDLPHGYTIEDMAQLVRNVSRRVYPRIPFINGFCFMIKREVISAIGYLDEENFPVGYGEENDYCIRASDAGFELAIADDVYIYHTKSRSFGHERRVELSRVGAESLKRKHTPEKYFSMIKKAAASRELDEIRERIKSVLAARTAHTRPNPFADDTGNGSVAKRKNEAAYVDEIDMNGKKIRLSPPPVYASKSYEVVLREGVSCITLPYQQGEPLKGEELNHMSIGVHLHLYYAEMLEEFINYLSNVESEFSLYVSVVDANLVDEVQRSLSASLKNARVIVRCFPNKGRDIAPFVVGFADELLKHDIVSHIHSKRSLHNKVKSDWRRQLLHGLFGSKSVVAEIIRILRDNAHIGMVFPEYHHSLRGQISWGTNFDIAKSLATRLSIEIDERSLTLFPAGSMFWARVEAIAPLLRLGLRWDDFPVEAGQVDGTTAHGLERVLGEVVRKTGKQLLQVRVDKPYNLVSYFTARWPYKPRRTNDEIRACIAAYRDRKSARKANYVVYTAITGGYDQPVVHETLSDSCDYILFTDGPANNRGFWDVRPIPYSSEQPVRRARHMKVNPHRYLRGYDVAVWIDANVIIRGDILKYIELAKQNPDCLLFGILHPQRDCVFDEARAVVEAKKDTEVRVREQMLRYERAGYPRKNGLIETNLMVINLRHPLAERLFDAWWSEIEAGSHRDQLSLNYCLWKVGASWLPIFHENVTLRDSPDFAYLGHGRNSGYLEPPSIEWSEMVMPR